MGTLPDRLGLVRKAGMGRVGIGGAEQDDQLLGEGDAWVP